MKCLCASTRRTARILTRFYEECLGPSGLTPAQFELLGTILRHSDWKQAQLAVDLGLDQTTLSRNLSSLLRCDWVKRVPGAVDKRQATYTLTESGRAGWQAALPHWKRAQDAMKERLGGEWQALLAAVDRLGTLADASGTEEHM